MAGKEELTLLLERVQKARNTNNALDIEIEAALFEPDELWASVRTNHAGTKLIYTARTGLEKTCWAWDWTLNNANQKQAADRIQSLLSQVQA